MVVSASSLVLRALATVVARVTPRLRDVVYLAVASRGGHCGGVLGSTRCDAEGAEGGSHYDGRS